MNHLIETPEGLAVVGELAEQPQDYPNKILNNYEQSFLTENSPFHEGEKIPGKEECRECCGFGSWYKGTERVNCEPCNGSGKKLLTVGPVELRQALYLFRPLTMSFEDAEFVGKNNIKEKTWLAFAQLEGE